MSFFGRTIAIDTETTGLERTDKPFLIIIDTPDEPTHLVDIRNGVGDSQLSLINNILRNANTVAFQNAKFDLSMLKRVGIEMPPHLLLLDDTSLARQQRNDHLQYSLDAQASRILGVGKDERVKALIKASPDEYMETRTTRTGDAYTVPRYDWINPTVMNEYAARDAQLTRQLCMEYTKDMTEVDQYLATLEGNLIRVCLDIEERGIQLNIPYTIEAWNHEQSILDKLLISFKDATGVDYVNSGKSIQKVLEFVLPITDKGNPSATDEVLAIVEKIGSDMDKSIASLIREIRYYDKRITTYYKSYIDLHHEGVIHPRMWISGTRTGRFSYSDPNLQNVPKEEKSVDPFVVRGCFKPRDGHIFVSMDYSQMEYRMMAAYAGEHAIIEAVNNGADFHQATADLFGVDRKMAKTLNFAILYGAGGEKLASMLGISEHEAAALKIKYFMALPRVERLVDKVISQGKRTGYITNWMGRRLYATRDFCYALPNHLIQSGGADVVKVAMLRIHQQFPEVPMVLQVHDQLVFEVKPEHFDKLQKIKEIMESVLPPINNIKLTVDVSWSDVSLAERDMKKGMPYES